MIRLGLHNEIARDRIKRQEKWSEWIKFWVFIPVFFTVISVLYWLIRQ